MDAEQLRRRSRFMLRAMEWNEPRARHPNLWKDGMPCQIMASDRVASRLRLGDLVAIYYPQTQRYPERSNRFTGISRVIGLRRAQGFGEHWVDLETAHRFAPPLDLGEAPRRVFLCCDPGWPEPEIVMFRRVFDAAVAAGWKPRPEEEETPAETSDQQQDQTPGRQDRQHEEPMQHSASEASRVDVHELPAVSAPSRDADSESADPRRMFAGAEYGGDMRDRRDGTWLAVLKLEGPVLRLTRLSPTGRGGLQSYLRDPDKILMHVEAIGLDFPFSLPETFAETLLGGPFPDEGWWALVRRMEKLTRPDFLVAVQEFRDSHGEVKRWTDETAQAPSPLHRQKHDLSPATYHGIRMIAEDRSRYAIRPFESAQGKLLLEVRPEAALRRLALSEDAKPREITSALEKLQSLRVTIDTQFLKSCHERPGALESVLAARCAAVAVLSGEVEKSPEELGNGMGERIRREGWIYGLGDSPLQAP